MKAITLSKANFALLYILASILAIIGFLVLCGMNFSGFSQKTIILTYLTIFTLGLAILGGSVSSKISTVIFLALGSLMIAFTLAAIEALALIPVTCACMAGFLLAFYPSLRNIFFKSAKGLPQLHTNLLLYPGLEVVISDPRHHDSPHKHGFSGIIESLSESSVCVRDMDSSHWDIEHDEIVEIVPNIERG